MESTTNSTCISRTGLKCWCQCFVTILLIQPCILQKYKTIIYVNPNTVHPQNIIWNSTKGKNLHLLLKLSNQEWYTVATRPFYDL